jgi:hypothetical protein
MLSSPAVAVQNASVRRRSRRHAETLLTEDDHVQARKRVRLTALDARAKNTKRGYTSYMNSVNEWYAINKPELCTGSPPVVDWRKFRQLCTSGAGVEEAAEDFTTFLDTRKHFKDLNADGHPAQAKSGTLTGYRSSMGNHIWGSTATHKAAIMPVGWHACMAEYIKGKKNREATKKQNGQMTLNEGYATSATSATFRRIRHFYVI